MTDSQPPKRYYHTKGILTYLLSVYPKPNKYPASSSSGDEAPKSRLASRFHKLSLADSSDGGYQSDDSVRSDAHNASTAEEDEKKIEHIISLLETTANGEQEDRPEQLKQALLQYITPKEVLLTHYPVGQRD